MWPLALYMPCKLWYGCSQKYSYYSRKYDRRKFGGQLSWKTSLKVIQGPSNFKILILRKSSQIKRKNAFARPRFSNNVVFSW